MFCPLWIDTINKPHTQRQIWQPAIYQGDQSKSVLHFILTEGSLAVLSISIYFITDAITNTYLVLFQFPKQLRLTVEVFFSNIWIRAISSFHLFMSFMYSHKLNYCKPVLKFVILDKMYPFLWKNYVSYEVSCPWQCSLKVNLTSTIGSNGQTYYLSTLKSDLAW